MHEMHGVHCPEWLRCVEFKYKSWMQGMKPVCSLYCIQKRVRPLRAALCFFLLPLWVWCHLWEPCLVLYCFFVWSVSCLLIKVCWQFPFRSVMTAPYSSKHWPNYSFPMFPYCPDLAFLNRTASLVRRSSQADIITLDSGDKKVDS